MHEILIVGEEGFVREMIAAAVDRTGLSVVCVPSVAEAEEDCRRGRYERVVVLGCAPFACEGSAVERLRPPGSRRPEIYVLAWHHSERAVMSLLECGVNQYLTFPVSLQRLCRKLNDSL